MILLVNASIQKRIISESTLTFLVKEEEKKNDKILLLEFFDEFFAAFRVQTFSLKLYLGHDLPNDKYSKSF